MCGSTPDADSFEGLGWNSIGEVTFCPIKVDPTALPLHIMTLPFDCPGNASCPIPSRASGQASITRTAIAANVRSAGCAFSRIDRRTEGRNFIISPDDHGQEQGDRLDL